MPREITTLAGWLRAAKNYRVDRLKAELLEGKSKIRSYRRSLTLQAKQLAAEKINKVDFEINQYRFKEYIQKQIERNAQVEQNILTLKSNAITAPILSQSLKRHKKVSGFIVDNTLLKVSTTPLTVMRGGSEHDLGRYIISISAKWIAHYDGQNIDYEGASYPHPHVGSSGKFCLGDYFNDARLLDEQCQFHFLVDFLIAFLSLANQDYSSYVSFADFFERRKRVNT